MRRLMTHPGVGSLTALVFVLIVGTPERFACGKQIARDPDWQRKFLHLAMRRERGIAKVVMARKLAVRLYWMWRKEWDYEQVKKFGSPPRAAVRFATHPRAV